MTNPIITLTTDFGLRDGYVGAMKGVILGICRDAAIVDISHEVPAQDIAHGAFVLSAACSYFPADAVHVAVVDPGVGTERALVLLVTPHGRYLAPDNGLLTHILAAWEEEERSEGPDAERERATRLPEGCRAFVLDRSEYWLDQTSDTFHGRDILAPVAAHLAGGAAPEDLGSPIHSVVRLPLARPRPVADGYEGQVVHVDRFGNLVSNIRLERLAETAGLEVEIGGERVEGLSRSYAEAEGLLAIVGSGGYLEVAVNGGSAARRLGAEIGDRIVARLPAS